MELSVVANILRAVENSGEIRGLANSGQPQDCIRASPLARGKEMADVRSTCEATILTSSGGAGLRYKEEPKRLPAEQPVAVRAGVRGSYF
jgi:hypothetical protein